MFNNDKKKLTVCYLGTYTPEYSRNSILISGLKKNGVDVLECKTVRRGFLKYVILIMKHWKIRNKYDVIIVGFQGIQAVILAKILTRKTVIFDAFASLYDSMVMDRKSVKANSFVAKYYWWLDKISMILADIVLFDTNENIDYAAKEFGIKKEKIQENFIGSNTGVFYPVERENHSKNLKFCFTAHSCPFMGIDHIISGKIIRRRKYHF